MEFNVLKTPFEAMDDDDKESCIHALRTIVQDDKAGWDKVAAILQVDGDDVDCVFAKVRILMANIGSDDENVHIDAARKQFPVLAAIHDQLDTALVYEMERFNRQYDELECMSIDEFVELKRKVAVSGTSERRIWRDQREDALEQSWLERFVGWIWDRF